MGNTNHTTSPELLPCPFCLSENIGSDRDSVEFPLSVVWCRNCGASMDDTTDCIMVGLPFDRWNTRQPQSLSTSLSDATIEAGVDAYGRMLGNYTIQEIVSEIYLAMEKAKDEASPVTIVRVKAAPLQFDDEASPADEVERMRSAILAAGVPMLTFSDADTLARAALSAIKGQQSTVDEVEEKLERIYKKHIDNIQLLSPVHPDVRAVRAIDRKSAQAVVERFYQDVLSAIRNGDEGMGS